MCIFVAPVRSVQGTQILVSTLPNGRQLIVYENHVHQVGKNAMVLPVPAGQPIELIDMSRYKGNVWDDCDALFPKKTSSFGFGGGFGAAPSNKWGSDQPPLPVQCVGGYHCTIVPALTDFGRVSRDVFYLPPDIEAVLKEHYGTGFSFIVCLFQDDVKAHPLAYTSGRTSNGQLFIPTRHAHGNPEKVATGSTTTTTTTGVIHQNVRCDACNCSPLTGTRWKCFACPNYDLCNDCYTQKRAVHSMNHPFLAITDPVQAPPPQLHHQGFTGQFPVFGFKLQGNNDAGDSFDHTLYVVNAVLAAAPSRYDDTIIASPHQFGNLGQLHIPLIECISKINIKGDFPNLDYFAVEVQ